MRAAVPVFVGIALVYAATACRTVGAADSAELTVALTTWGVPHAPGYPWMALTGNLLTHALPFLDAARLLNVANALVSALACAVLAAAVATVTASAAAGVAAGLALGTSRAFWLTSLTLEVFGLVALLAAALLYLLARLLDPRAPSAAPWVLPAVAFILTTLVTHHPTLALVAVPVTVVVVGRTVALQRDPARRIALGPVAARCGIAVVLGLLPLLYVPIAAHFEPALDWGDVRTPGAFLALLLRRDFGTGTLVSPAIVVEQLLEHGEQASPLGWRHFAVFWRDVPRSFGWAFVPLPILGLAWSARRRRSLLVLAAGVLAVLALFFARVNAPDVPLFRSVVERFFVLPHVVLAFYAGCGVALVSAWASRWRGGRAILVALLTAVTAVPMLATHWRAVDQHRNTFTRDFGANLLAGVPPRAIFFTNGDEFHHALLYQQACLHQRPDVTVVSQELLAWPWYAEQQRRRGALRVPAPRAANGSRAWLALNEEAPRGGERRPAVAVQFVDDSYRQADRLVPVGIWSRVLPLGQRIDVEEWERASEAGIRDWRLGALDLDCPEASWEGTHQVFHAYALGQLQGLRDLVDVMRASTSTAKDSDTRMPSTGWGDVPALDHAAAWKGTRAAELLAYRADFLRACLDDSLVPRTSATDRAIARLAMRHARAALTLDERNLQALQTTASLLASRPEWRDPAAELGVRGRIVAQRPGDPGELVPYFRLALARARTAPDAGAATLAEARAVQARYVRLLAIAVKIDPRPELAALRQRWDVPLADVPELREPEIVPGPSAPEPPVRN